MLYTAQSLTPLLSFSLPTSWDMLVLVPFLGPNKRLALLEHELWCQEVLYDSSALLRIATDWKTTPVKTSMASCHQKIKQMSYD